MASNLQERLDVFRETRRAMLAGELESNAAVARLQSAGWSVQEATTAVSAWRTLSTLRTRHEGQVSIFHTTSDLDEMARLLKLPEFGKEGGDE